MRVLILGGTGQLGRLLGTYLHNAGFQVTVTGRHRPKDRPVGIGFHSFNVLKQTVNTLPAAEVRINCIGLLTHPCEVIYQRIHEAFVRELDALDGYLIQISALGARADHPVRFLRARGKAENWLRHGKGSYGILRPSIVLTPGTLLLQNLKKLVWLRSVLGFSPLPDGGSVKLQPVAGDDLCEAVINLIEGQPRHTSLDVVGPKSFTLKQLSSMACRAHGIKPRDLSLPSYLALPAAWIGEWFGGKTFSREHLRLLKWDNVGSPLALTRLLGHGPKTIMELLLDTGMYGEDSKWLQANVMINLELGFWL